MKSVHLYATPRSLYAVSRDGHVSRVDVDDPGGVAGPALGTAAKWLRARSGFGARVELTLASSLVRFVTVPWIAGTFTGGAIRRQVARALAELHGEDPARWQLCIQWPRYGWPAFAVAYPSGLMAAVAESLLAAELTLDRTVASAAAVVSRYASGMPRGASFVGFQEDDGLTGVHLHDGEIAEVEFVSHQAPGLDAPDVWGSRKRFEFPTPGQLRWVQAGHCPSAFAGLAFTAAGSGSACASTDLLKAIRR